MSEATPSAEPRPLADDSDEHAAGARYRRLRARSRNWLLLVAAAIALAVVLRKPEHWGDGQLAYIVRAGALVLAALAAVLAFRAHGRQEEQRGFCRGKFGRPPRELDR